MKKVVIIIFVLILLNFYVNFSSAQSSKYAPIDENTGLPKEFIKFSEMSEKLSEEEQREAYLKQEWTKILAGNKILGPTLFYTNKFFIVFNPFWKVVFGIEFTWSWEFIFSLIIWIAIIYLIYSPAKAFLTNLHPALSLIVSAIVASLAGISGTIKHLTTMLILFLTNPWYVWAAIIAIILSIYLYHRSMSEWGKNFRKSEEEDQLKKDRETIHADAETSKKRFENAQNR